MTQTLTEQAQEVLTLLGMASEPVQDVDKKLHNAVIDLCHAAINVDSSRPETQMVPNPGL